MREFLPKLKAVVTSNARFKYFLLYSAAYRVAKNSEMGEQSDHINEIISFLKTITNDNFDREIQKNANEQLARKVLVNAINQVNPDDVTDIIVRYCLRPELNSERLRYGAFARVIIAANNPNMWRKPIPILRENQNRTLVIPVNTEQEKAYWGHVKTKWDAAYQLTTRYKLSAWLLIALLSVSVIFLLRSGGDDGSILYQLAYACLAISVFLSYFSSRASSFTDFQLSAELYNELGQSENAFDELFDLELNEVEEREARKDEIKGEVLERHRRSTPAFSLRIRVKADRLSRIPRGKNRNPLSSGDDPASKTQEQNTGSVPSSETLIPHYPGYPDVNDPRIHRIVRKDALLGYAFFDPKGLTTSRGAADEELVARLTSGEDWVLGRKGGIQFFIGTRHDDHSDYKLKIKFPNKAPRIYGKKIDFEGEDVRPPLYANFLYSPRGQH